MDLWHPRAIRVEPNPRTDGGSFDTSYSWRQVVHTTEGGPNYSPTGSSYFGNPYWPHATVARVGGVATICQHIAINRAARALENDSGGVETNKARAVQLEIGWWADRIAELPADLAHAARDWLLWAADQTDTPTTGPRFTAQPVTRMSFAAWRSFSGICGHQHIPEQEHWDPGALDLAKLLGTTTPPPPSEEDEMIDDSCIPSWAAPANGRWPFFRLTCGDNAAPFEAQVLAYPGAPLAAGLDKNGWRYGDTFGIPTLFMTGLAGKPVSIEEAPGGSIIVVAADGGTFLVSKKPGT